MSASGTSFSYESHQSFSSHQESHSRTYMNIGGESEFGSTRNDEVFPAAPPIQNRQNVTELIKLFEGGMGSDHSFENENNRNRRHERNLSDQKKEWEEIQHEEVVEETQRRDEVRPPYPLADHELHSIPIGAGAAPTIENGCSVSEERTTDTQYHIGRGTEMTTEHHLYENHFEESMRNEEFSHHSEGHQVYREERTSEYRGNVALGFEEQDDSLRQYHNDIHSTEVVIPANHYENVIGSGCEVTVIGEGAEPVDLPQIIPIIPPPNDLQGDFLRRTPEFNEF